MCVICFRPQKSVFLFIIAIDSSRSMGKKQFNQFSRPPYVTCGLAHSILKLHFGTFETCLFNNKYAYLFLILVQLAEIVKFSPLARDMGRSEKLIYSHTHIWTGLLQSLQQHIDWQEREGMNGYSVSDTRAQNENGLNTHRYGRMCDTYGLIR